MQEHSASFSAKSENHGPYPGPSVKAEEDTVYEIIMSSGDRAECETIAAALVTAKTLCDDVDGEAAVMAVVSERSAVFNSGLRMVLNQHLYEGQPS